MGVFTKCSNCGTLCIGGRRDGEQLFCSKQCQEWWHAPGFCEACAGETTDQALGGCFTLNAVGTKLYHLACKGKPCPNCHSVTQRKWFVALYLPIFPVSREYRVKYMNTSRYISRKLVRTAPASAAPAFGDAAGGRKCRKCGTVFADAKVCPVCEGRAAVASR